MNDGDELIVVDDGSTDGSYELLQEMSIELPLVLVRNHNRQGKKRALEIGCKRATNGTILQTDADCHPRSEEWADRMRGAAAQGAGLVLGWGSIEGGNGLLSAFLRYETARKALHYSAAAMLGAPYMGVGRNLLYHKQLRTDSKMPTSYYRTMSGDDDLFIAHAGKRTRTMVVAHPYSHTVSAPPNTWKEHWNRSRRQAEAGLSYPLGTLFYLGLLELSEIAFFGTTILLLFSDRWFFVLMSFLALLFLRAAFMSIRTKPLIPRSLTLLTPLLAFISLMNRTFVEGSVLISKPTRWR